MKWTVGATLAATLVACGGGGGGGSTAAVGATPAASVLSGTASAGSPLSSATIVLTDGSGKTLSASAAADGSYTFSDIGKLTAPILVTATGDSGGTTVNYSSVVTAINAAKPTVANVSPITDAIVSQATGLNGTALAGDPTRIKAIDPARVQQISASVAAALANVLEGLKAGSSAGYDPITTSFSANGTAPQDKLMDLVSIATQSQLSGSTLTINITITDKSGSSGMVSIAPTATAKSVTVLPAADPTIAALPIDKIPVLLAELTRLASTTTGLNSTAFADLMSDNFLRYGQNKAQHLAEITTPSSANYALAWALSNPTVTRCDAAFGACLVADTEVYGGDTHPGSIWIIWNPAKGIWQWYGNQQQDLNVGFSTSLTKTDANNSILAELDFSIRDIKKLYPYNSASAVFQDKNGVVDYRINFAQKAACSTTSPTYWGLPVDNPANPGNATFCGNWINFPDETILNTINQKIALGGYQLIVKAYASSDRSGTGVQVISKLSAPLLTKAQVAVSEFPAVTAEHDPTGPYLSIQYANQFTHIGSVCLSSATSPTYCDGTNRPAHTTVYGGTGKPLLTTYRPLAADNWLAPELVHSYYVHAMDRYGRDLRVNN